MHRIRTFVLALITLGTLGGVGTALARGGTPLAASDPNAVAIANHLATFVGTLDQVDPLDALAAAVPVQARTELADTVDDAQAFADEAQALLTSAAGSADLTLTKLDQRLDDLDGDGDSTDDIPLPGMTVDINGTVSPKTASAQYTITLEWSLRADGSGPVAFAADGIAIGGRPLSGGFTIGGDASFQFRPGDAVPRTFLVTGITQPFAQLGLDIGADFGDTDPAHGGNTPPLTVDVGILSASAVGVADADVRVGVSLVDANGDGVIDTNELANPGSLFTAGCSGGEVHAHLDVTASLSGLAGKTGHIDLDDLNVCNGVPVPSVALGALDFRTLSPEDLLNGLGQLTTALRGLQSMGDLDIPFVQEGVAAFAAVHEKLVRFFVDNGLTDPADPMGAISFTPTKLASLDTLQEVLPPMAAALGVPDAALGLAWANDAVTFTVDIAGNPAPIANAGTLDFGDQLARTGLVGLTGSAKATIDPSYALDLGIGIDLRPGLTLAQRFFFRAGAGPEISLDALVSANLDLTGTIALLDVNAKDANAGGSVPLLERSDATKPMVALDIDGQGDDRLTLDEIATGVVAGNLPVDIAVNAKVPPTDLVVTTSIAGSPLASGKVTVSWPNVAVPGLSVTADGAFQATALPFAFDPNNPRAAIGQFLSAAREAIVRLRGLLTTNAKTVADLPLVGRSTADLDPILGKLATALDDLIATTTATKLEEVRDQLAHLVATTLGLPPAAEAALLTLDYQPATSGARAVATKAAIIGELALGICTNDRATSACTKTVAKPTFPLNLQLGSTAEAIGLAGVSGDGNVAVSFDAVLRLNFGVELPTVTPGAAGSPPSASGPPSLIVIDDSSLSIGLGAVASGNLAVTVGPITAEIRSAVADLGARFRLAAPAPSGERLVVGSPAFTSWLNSLAPAAVHDPPNAASCPPIAGSFDACAVLPVFLGDTDLGDITFTAPDLLNPGGWTFDADDVIAAVQSEDIGYDMLFDGLKALSDRLAAALKSVPAGTTIPLLGTDLTAGANVVADFLDGVVTPAVGLADDLRTATQAGNLRSKARQWFIANVGPGSAHPILLDSDGVEVVDGNDVNVSLTCLHGSTPGPCVDSDPISSLQAIEVRAALGDTITGAAPRFDIGFPGFRLASDGKLTGQAGFRYNLAFGIDKERGFYIPTVGPRPELEVTASVGLPNLAAPAPDLTGDIAFIPFTLDDLHAGPDVELAAGIDIAGGDSDGHLGLQQLGTVSVTPSISVCANVSIKMATNFGGATSALPNVFGTLNMRGGYTCSGAIGAPPGTGFAIGFENVAVDVGSFISRFIRPVASQIHEFTEPLEPVVDAIREPVPGVAEAAKLAGLPPPSWYDLFKLFGTANGNPEALQVIDRVILLVDLVRQLDANPSGNGTIALGSFDINAGMASQPLTADKLGQLVQSPSLISPASVLDRLHDAGISVPALEALDSARSAGGFTFPVWDQPTQVFGLLVGQDVTLVRFDAGTLEAGVDKTLEFGVGPIVLSIGFEVRVEGHAAIAYDTAGFRRAFQLITDDDPSNDGPFNFGAGLLQGLYIEDLDKQGQDRPEITLFGQITLGAGLGIPGFNVKIEGGINGQIDFDLHDPEPDGKVRFTEIVDQLDINPNPLCLFKASARIGAFVQLKFNALFISFTFPIADVVLYEEPDSTAFCNAPDPGLARKYGDGTLVLKATDQPDNYVVEQIAAGKVVVRARGHVQEFNGITRVFADGGGGADQVVVTSRVATPLPAILCGGADSDNLTGSAGAGQIFGDDGPGIDIDNNGTPVHLDCAAADSGGGDQLTGGHKFDILDGGPGNDVLVGADGNDTLRGGPGNDTMRGGNGNDQLQGAGGDDATDYSDHSGGVLVVLNGNGGQIGTTEVDLSSECESVLGSPFDDDLRAQPNGVSRLDGLAGNDLLNGGNGPDFLFGSDGNDTLRPNGDLNQLFGGPGDDTFINGAAGLDTFLGGPGFDTSDYSAATTPVALSVDNAQNDGPSGDLRANVRALDNIKESEHLIGGSATDTISGASSNDRLEGRGSADNLLGGGGDDILEGGPGDDWLDGNPGGDDFAGGAGFDTADYSNRSDPLVIKVDGVANDGGAPDEQHDNVRTDIEHDLGGQNSDYILARPADDVVEGGPGDDVVVGNNGNDRLDGQTGDDVAIGGSGTDTIVGGDGDDELSGHGGRDTISGDLGDDVVNAGDGNDSVIGADGRDTLRGGAGGDTVDGGAQNDLIYGDSAFLGAGEGADTLIGGEGDDRIFGAGGNDVIQGLAGGDALHGEAGDDSVSGGDGRDRIEGGIGNDTLSGGKDSDTVDGNDGDDQAAGDAGADVVRGSAGNDTLGGGDADDTVAGGTGDDRLDGGAGADQLIGELGVDTADYSSRTEALSLSIDGLDNDGSAIDSNRDAIDRTVEVMLAGSGADALTVATDLAYTLDGGAGNDVLTVAGFVVRRQELRGGTGNDRLTGGSGDDLLDGGAGNDTETGGAGDDTLDQGPVKNGRDDLSGGAGFDQVDYSERSGTVTVTFDGVADDGNANERDNARPDLEAALM